MTTTMQPEASRGWTAPEPSRQDPPPRGGEREQLEAWLDYHRQTLLAKCAGLTGEQLALASVPPSNLTLLGLVRHMAEVERSWFRDRFSGQADAGDIYCTEEQPDADLENGTPARAEQDYATLAAEISLARAAVAGRGLDETYHNQRRDAPMDLRWIYLHMIEEYARHNGHADLIRERIDGRTGE
ncbi:MAG TPA: DinB family protein [Trebonia sp.]|nr:DinB family protein [Trebonia sp.]